MLSRKVGLIGSIAVSLLAVSVASISTLAWFQINSNAEVAQPTQTKNIQTNATVYQSNAHSNDDTYQTTPTTDMGGTLSYDHSRGGKATNYYIRQYGGASEITLQMYTNENNTDDKAVYYNIKFSNKWKIYEASTPEHYYGYDDIEPSDPLLGLCGVDGDRNITIGSLTGYYDVYFTSSNKIWIVEHSETTTSDEMGNETGYYLYGSAADSSSALTGHGDIDHGIPMYVNAAAGTSDLAYYAGLRLSESDVMYLASGDTTNPYTSSQTGGDNLLNNSSYFTLNTTTGAITCNQLGYYCVALTSSSNIHITKWDGMEVDGTTRYTVNDSGGNPLRASHNRPTRAAAKDSKYYVKGSQWGSWGTPQVMSVGQDYYFIELSINNNTEFGIQDNSTFRGWSALQNTPWKNNFSQSGSNIKCTYGATYYIFLDGGNIYIYMNYLLITGADLGWSNTKTSSNELLWDEDNGQWYRTDVNLTYGSGDNRFNILQDGSWSRLTNYSKMGGDLKSTNFQQKTSGSDDDIMVRSGKNGYYNLYFKPWKSTNLYISYTSYSVTLNKNGGSCSDLTNYTYGTGATLPNTVTKSGYNFKGWYDNSSFTGSAVTTISSTDHGNKVFWAKFVEVYTVSFAYWDVTNNVSVSGTPATSKTIEKGLTFTFPSVPSAPSHYNLYNSETKWHAGKTTGSTSYNGGSTSPAVNSSITYYVLLTPVPTCNINYYKSYNGVSQPSTTYTNVADQGFSFSVHSLPGAENGYILTGWYTNPNGTGTQYVASSSMICPNQSTLNLYACYSYKSYNYYLTGNLKGNYSTGSGSVLQSANYGATTVSWNVDLAIGEKWKLYSPNQDSFSPFNGDRWWGYTTGKTGDVSYFKDDGTNDHNIETIFAGNYTITLTLASGNINFTLNTLSASNFTLYQYAPGGGNQKTITSSRTSNDVFTFTVSGDNKFLAGNYWHITGPSDDYLWGYKTSSGDNIAATSNYSYWFADSGNALADPTIHDSKNLYSMTCTVTFTLSTNSIVVSDISLVDDQFQLKTASSTIATQGTSVSPTGSVTFSNIHLATDTPWYLHVGGMIKYSFNSIDTNVTMLGQSTPKATYFYIADDGADYIGTGYGGTYNIVFNVATHVMSITCTNLDLTDFKAVRGSGSTEGTSMVFRTVNASAHTATYTGSTHLFIDETLYFVNDNTGAKSDSASCTHNYYFNGDIASANLNGSNLVYIDGGYLKSRVDVTINYTFTFLATSANTTKANFAITSITENTDISFNHAEDAGIYIETATNNSFTSGVVKKMMHTTSGKDMNGNTYLAQEAPIYTSSGTSYLRVIKTHSNGSGTTPNASTIRSLTEYYYVAQDSSQAGFSSSTSTRSVTGNGNTAYVAVSTAGTWTVSLRTDGAIHIEPYSGASTVSTEHEVPYYLIGRGMPGSGIRDCDYTTEKGIKLWTYGGNSSTVPCYVGTYGNNNTNPSNYIGTGIALKKGDTFALSSVSKLIKSFVSNSVDGVSINTTTGIVTVNTSGTYRIYLTGSVGSESINISKISTDTDWTRSGDIISQNGVSLISSSGNTLTLGGNLDYSLLDAFGADGYTFEIELSHVSSGASGTMYYSITNSNGYSIDVAMKQGDYSSAGSYSANTTIANGSTSNNLYNRSIGASTTTSTTIRVTLTAEQIRSMISSGSYSFSMTISYSFTESTIS